MNRRTLPNFSGRNALIVHKLSENTGVLKDQLERLGVSVELRWPVEQLTAGGVDLIFFDADRGYDQQFSWKSGTAPIPLIALMGSEAPGRIEWALAQMPSAYLMKPLRPNGIFCALAIAFHDFEFKSNLMRKVEDLNARIKARPSVVTAINIVQSSLSVESAQAYELLRTEAMKHRISIEMLCEQIESAGSLVPLKKLEHRRGSGTQSKDQNANIERRG